MNKKDLIKKMGSGDPVIIVKGEHDRATFNGTVVNVSMVEKMEEEGIVKIQVSEKSPSVYYANLKNIPSQEEAPEQEEELEPEGGSGNEPHVQLSKEEFLELPMSERRKLLQDQAEDPEMVAYYTALMEDNGE